MGGERGAESKIFLTFRVERKGKRRELKVRKIFVFRVEREQKEGGLADPRGPIATRVRPTTLHHRHRPRGPIATRVCATWERGGELKGEGAESKKNLHFTVEREQKEGGLADPRGPIATRVRPTRLHRRRPRGPIATRVSAIWEGREQLKVRSFLLSGWRGRGGGGS